MEKKKKIAVIGGGAAGMFAAITCAKEGGEVTVLEGGDRLGKKILSTGNGKCNLTNLEMSPQHYYSQNIAFVEQALKNFDQWDTLSAFRRMGLMLRDKNGYIYPACEQAAVVLDILRLAVRNENCNVLTECKVHSIEPTSKGGFKITDEQKKTYYFDKVILACGGKAAPKTGSDGSGYTISKALGHTLVPIVPALVQLHGAEDYFKTISGVRADGMVRLYIDGREAAFERGEIQFTDLGISGIPVFQISRVANYALRQKKRVTALIDLLPDMTLEELSKQFRVHCLTLNECTVEEAYLGMLNKKLMLAFLKESGLKPNESLQNAEQEKLEKVLSFCKNLPVTVTGSHSFDQAQVCAGGVSLEEIKDTMESKVISGLYFAGELLDVDGKCGGYNLQWAWTSGYLAGVHAAKDEK